eukprot:366436-Pleurochrysis_carterae.AAC.1
MKLRCKCTFSHARKESFRTAVAGAGAGPGRELPRRSSTNWQRLQRMRAVSAARSCLICVFQSTQTRKSLRLAALLCCRMVCLYAANVHAFELLREASSNVPCETLRLSAE